MKMNQEMYNKFKSPAIVTVTEIRRSEWLGLVRMGGDRAVQKVVVANQEEGVKKYRSRFSWVDDVTSDLRRIWV
jgi:hypothetical protein